MFTAEERAQWAALEKRIAPLKLKLKRLDPVAMSLRHTFGPPFEPGTPVTYVLIRGNFDHKGEEVEPGFLSAITGNQRPAVIPLDPYRKWPTADGDKVLAKWIPGGENPLTARVMVNRLWQHHFAQGIVATPSDFGVLGSPRRIRSCWTGSRGDSSRRSGASRRCSGSW